MNMKIKKVISSLLIMTLLIISNIGIFAKNELTAKEENPTTLEYFNLTELEKHPDVKQYLEKHNINDKNIDTFLNKQFEKVINEKLSVDSTDENKPSIQELEKISQKYGLESPKMINESEIFILAEKDNTLSGISNVWYLYYTTTDYSFSINVAQVGEDPLDRISGTVFLYGLDGYTWEHLGKKTFSKYQVSNGRVYSWSIRKKTVEEKFNYDITLTEDGQTHSYHNYGNATKEHKRWWYEGGAYKNLDALGGERHHIVSQSALKSAGFSAYSAPCVRMTKEDHTKTPNYGSYTSSKNFRAKELKYLKNKDYEDLLKIEVNALKKIDDPEDCFSNLAQKCQVDGGLADALWIAEKYFGID